MKYKRYWVQILAWIVCAAVAYKLYATVQEDKKNDAERYALLQMQAANREQLDNEKLEAQTDIYDRFYAQVELDDFICWGDTAMAGRSSRSLPKTLESIVEQNLFSQLEKTFSRVLENEEYTIPSVTVNNMGISNEGMRQILARAGANSLELGERIEIPWSKDPVSIRFMDDEAWSKVSDKNKEEQLKFATQKDVGFGKVYIDGIRGSLETTDDWFDANHPRYAFVRKDEGEENITVDAGTPIEIETATKYLGNVPVVFFEDVSGRSVDGFVSDVVKLVNRYAYIDQSDQDTNSEDNDNNGDISANITNNLPYVVICTAEEDSDIDRAMKKQFGDHYIRNDGYSAEMTERTYRKLAQQVYDNLDAQGCFDEIKSQIAVAINEAEGL